MPITFENIFDVSGSEKNGRLVSLRRRGYVHGLTSTNPTAYVEEVLSSAAVPSPGSAITINGSLLYLKSREVNAADSDALGDAKVDLIYERNEGSSEGDPEATPTLRGGTTLKQVETQKDAEGNQITVSHTWPSDANGTYPNGKPKAGTTETQGGKIRVLVPMSTVSGSFLKATATPGAITKAYSGHVNDSTWQSGAPRTWMCTSATFELVDDTVDPPLYKLDFTFEYDENTWDNDTTAVFIDSSTGEAPSGLVDGTGIKQIEYYPEKNFNEDF